MTKTFDIIHPPKTKSDLRRLLQSQDTRLQQLQYKLTGSLPPYGPDVELNSDSAVQKLFKSCLDKIKFDVHIDTKGFEDLHNDLVDEDMVTLHIFPPSGSPNRDLIERVFLIPPTPIANALARTVKLSILEDPPGGGMMLVVYVLQKNGEQMELRDDKKLRKMLQSCARAQTPCRVTYRWASSGGSLGASTSLYGERNPPPSVSSLPSDPQGLRTSSCPVQSRYRSSSDMQKSNSSTSSKPAVVLPPLFTPVTQKLPSGPIGGADGFPSQNERAVNASSGVGGPPPLAEAKKPEEGKGLIVKDTYAEQLSSSPSMSGDDALKDHHETSSPMADSVLTVEKAAIVADTAGASSSHPASPLVTEDSSVPILAASSNTEEEVRTATPPHPSPAATKADPTPPLSPPPTPPPPPAPEKTPTDGLPPVRPRSCSSEVAEKRTSPASTPTPTPPPANAPVVLPDARRSTPPCATHKPSPPQAPPPEAPLEPVPPHPEKKEAPLPPPRRTPEEAFPRPISPTPVTRPSRKLVTVSVVLLKEGGVKEVGISSTYQYFKGAADLLDGFTQWCAKEAQLTVPAGSRIEIGVQVGKEKHLISDNLTLLEWMAMAREADRPLRVIFALRREGDGAPKSSSVAAAAAVEEPAASSSPQSKDTATHDALPTTVGKVSKEPPVTTPPQPEKEKESSPTAKAVPIMSKRPSGGATTLAHPTVTKHDAVQESPNDTPPLRPPPEPVKIVPSRAMTCAASSKFGKLLQLFVQWECRESLVMCRARSGSMLADLKRSICFEFRVPPKTESLQLRLRYKQWASHGIFTEGEVLSDAQLSILVRACPLLRLSWEVHGMSLSLGTAAFEYEISLFASELMGVLGTSFCVSELQKLLDPVKKYFQLNSHLKFFRQLETMPESRIRVSVKDMEALLQHCFKGVDTDVARCVTSACMSNLLICRTREQALRRFFAVMYRSMRKPNGSVPLAVLEEIFEKNQEPIPESLRKTAGSDALLSETDLVSSLMARFEEEQKNLMNCLSMAAMEGIIRTTNYYEYPITSSGAVPGVTESESSYGSCRKSRSPSSVDEEAFAVSAVYREELQNAVNRFTVHDLEDFCDYAGYGCFADMVSKKLTSAQRGALTAVLSVVGAFLSPPGTCDYVEYMREHCRGMRSAVFYSRMTTFALEEEQACSLPILYTVIWTLLRPQLDSEAIRPYSPVGAALVEWALIACQVECVRRDSTFPVMPPFNSISRVIQPVHCEVNWNTVIASLSPGTEGDTPSPPRSKMFHKYMLSGS